ncbi:polyphosphate kinase 1 [Mucilaginibacter ginkgonis]|uniref:Polyphosphate kinase n=1 Tax=Mucilaginibacter ginkgonis TaxID=2682091 RepID=A0A6I4IMZ3_9SPHI|nr:polyphosphate kinase 1 [Mucilaginibacter ginkgonis]QQL49850.1 polyphosphate kinase 1 [Mucilaginibacter ginkgonis]
MEEYRFFNRDLSWLGFNSRVLEEAANSRNPLLERIKFLSIFSSNLDEFYRVRMPVIAAMKKIGKKKSADLDETEHADIFYNVTETINNQLNRFGEIFTLQLLPALTSEHITLLYEQPVPEKLKENIDSYFLAEVTAFLQPVLITRDTVFFPENNKLYFLVETAASTDTKLYILNIPSDVLDRFMSIDDKETLYILFIDDVIKQNLNKIFTGSEIKNCFSFKVTRDAELDLKDDYSGDLSKEIEKQLQKRDQGLATRFLYDGDMPDYLLEELKKFLNITKATSVAGGCYHNLKDLMNLPAHRKDLSNTPWPVVVPPGLQNDRTIADTIATRDLMIHPPYNNYDAVLRFFNEASIDKDVSEIYVTLYRVASHSLIVNALISAAKNGKSVTVVVELKARFDEANNLHWAKKMMDAGVKIIYSVTALKVHAKIALVKKRLQDKTSYYGLLATGNLNETTAKFYTDHILFTSNKALLREMELLFIILGKRAKPGKFLTDVSFENLLVAQFNLKDRFLELIDREIANKKQGLHCGIIIKLNNLEEEALIGKLYEASNAGVIVQLIVRGICCLIPGVPGMSENITVRRIVDRYLEHGRVFIFDNNGNEEIYMGSADWMNRNIYHRIEVCFPIYDAEIKKQVRRIIDLQLQDNTQAVTINSLLENVPIMQGEVAVESQKEIYEMIASTSLATN